MSQEQTYFGKPIRPQDLQSILDITQGFPVSKEKAELIYNLYVLGLRKKKLYLIGSLRNEFVPALAGRLRVTCPDVEIFDDWYAAGREADDMWKEYEQGRRGYKEALNGYAAGHVFEFDKHHLDTCSHSLLVLPAGKSGHMEIMYAKYSAGANCAILLEQGADPRWDVMYKFIDNIFETTEEVEEWLNG